MAWCGFLSARQTAGRIGLALAACATFSASAWTEECAKAEFETVVGDAAGALRELNQKNKPVFQARLKALREKRGWSHDQFLKEATPFVQDDRIAEYDQRSQEFLERIQTMGGDAPMGAQSCKSLAEVRGYMKALVEVQTAKWTYMFGRLNKELEK